MSSRCDGNKVQKLARQRTIRTRYLIENGKMMMSGKNSQSYGQPERLRCFGESFGLPLQLRKFRAAHSKSQRALVQERSDGTERRYLDCIERELFVEIVERNRLRIE